MFVAYTVVANDADCWVLQVNSSNDLLFQWRASLIDSELEGF